MRTLLKTILLSALLIIGVSDTTAQDIKENDIIIEKEILSESTIKLLSIANNGNQDIQVSIKTNAHPRRERIDAGSKMNFNIECVSIQASVVGGSGGKSLWNKNKTKKEWKKLHPQQIQSNASAITQKTEKEERSSDPKRTVETYDTQNEINTNNSQLQSISGESIINAFMKHVEKDIYFSSSAINNTISDIDYHIECIKNWTDKDAYIQKHELIDYIKYEGKKIETAKKEIRNISRNFLSQYDNNLIDSNFSCEDSIIIILNKRITLREDALHRLQSVIEPEKPDSFFNSLNEFQSSTVIKIASVIFVIIILIIWFAIIAKRKSNQNKKKDVQQKSNATDASPTIVVRRKTTSILKKQSLEDVIDNTSYMRIECSDFCTDSAVRRIYIKNACIKDIYNMYAEDLRNPNNPKEDGCMVLGRWVYDEKCNEYYISLEQIVKPGDDAVFQEYELNFGGKIKLKVAEQLRKLRRETNLQYDLTCWVHSHPGLGVFFSNSDSSVQMQLKHPTHPNFLVAIVIDILTPQQELGIFTFKHDSTINSKNDLKKMYSLEQMHKWAIESEKLSYRPEDYYNILAKSTLKNNNCHSIQLNNGAIIDLCSIVAEFTNGIVGWGFGYQNINKGQREYIINSITKTSSEINNEPLGCLIIGTHCSIPTLKKAIAQYADKIHFILFYSSSDDMVTTIPLIDGMPIIDDKFYGEEKLEVLKIWTRRKR